MDTKESSSTPPPPHSAASASAEGTPEPPNPKTPSKKKTKATSGSPSASTKTANSNKKSQSSAATSNSLSSSHSGSGESAAEGEKADTEEDEQTSQSQQKSPSSHLANGASGDGTDDGGDETPPCECVQCEVCMAENWWRMAAYQNKLLRQQQQNEGSGGQAAAVEGGGGDASTTADGDGTGGERQNNSLATIEIFGVDGVLTVNRRRRNGDSEIFCTSDQDQSFVASLPSFDVSANAATGLDLIGSAATLILSQQQMLQHHQDQGDGVDNVPSSDDLLRSDFSMAKLREFFECQKAMGVPNFPEEFDEFWLLVVKARLFNIFKYRGPEAYNRIVLKIRDIARDFRAQVEERERKEAAENAAENTNNAGGGGGGGGGAMVTEKQTKKQKKGSSS